MNNLKYFFQFLIIILLLSIFKLIGSKYSTILSGKIFELIGPIFRSNKISSSNLSLALTELDETEKNKIIKKMWNNYGKILADYVFIKNYRNSKNFSDKIVIKKYKKKF